MSVNIQLHAYVIFLFWSIYYPPFDNQNQHISHFFLSYVYFTEIFSSDNAL